MNYFRMTAVRFSNPYFNFIILTHQDRLNSNIWTKSDDLTLVVSGQWALNLIPLPWVDFPTAVVPSAVVQTGPWPSAFQPDHLEYQQELLANCMSDIHMITSRIESEQIGSDRSKSEPKKPKDEIGFVGLVTQFVKNMQRQYAKNASKNILWFKNVTHRYDS